MQLRKKVFENGLRVLVAPVRDARTVTVLVFVAAGSKYEKKSNNGISHFLEHLCFKGTQNRPSPSLVSYAFDELGAENNAFTSEEFTGYYAKSSARHLDNILELVADVYLNATIPKDEIERERGVVIEEINLYNDQPTWHAEDLITDLLYGNQPAGWEVLGTKENIRRISRETIVRYREEHYVARGTTVVVVGSVSANDVMHKIKDLFSGISRGPKTSKLSVVENQKHPRAGVRYRKTDQAHIVLGIRTVPFSHKNVWPLSVLTTLLGGGMSSRLFKRLRDELGLCYYVNASQRLFTDHGYLSIRAGVSKDRVEEAIKEILLLCRSFKDELVSEKELRKAKNYHIGTMYLGLESTDSLAWSYGMQEMLGGNVLTPAARARHIRGIGSDDIRRVAKGIFKDDHLNLAVVGPYKGTGQFTRVLHV